MVRVVATCILMKIPCSADHTAVRDQTTCMGIKIVNEYDQEIPQTADKPYHCEEEPHNNHSKPERQTKQPALSSPSRLIT